MSQSEAHLRARLAKRAVAEGRTVSGGAVTQPPAKRQRDTQSDRSASSQPIAQVTLGGSAYEVLRGGRSLRRSGSGPGGSSSAAAVAARAAADAAATAAKAAAAAVARYVEAAGIAEGTSTRPLPKPKPHERPSATSLRHVSVPGAAFEATPNGMGLQRRRADGTGGRPGPPRTTVDFQRQRRADEARAAKGAMLCFHFCRYGHCSRDGAECPYEHDPSRVAICQPFLHGRCTAAVCVLSHEPTPERMPVCRLYQRGLCVASACEYSHIHRGGAAEVCDAFSRGGYCPEGERCVGRHEMACELAARGECALGDRCKLGRPKVSRGAQRRQSTAGADAASLSADDVALREDGLAAKPPMLDRRSSIVPQM